MISLYFKRAHVTKVASRQCLKRGTPVLCANLDALA